MYCPLSLQTKISGVSFSVKKKKRNKSSKHPSYLKAKEMLISTIANFSLKKSSVVPVASIVLVILTDLVMELVGFELLKKLQSKHLFVVS